MAASEAQAAVDAFFDRDAPHWQSIYGQADIFSVIHQRRQRLAFDWIKSLALAPGAAVLEVGCGAGLLAVALARAGFAVTASDSTTSMLELAATNAARSGVDVRLVKLDVHRIDAAAGDFDVVVALGVVPWLHSPEVALAEMARVVRPGGHVVVNADNSARLASWLDPLYSPPLAPMRRAARRILGRHGATRASMPPTVRHSRRGFDAALRQVGLSKVRGQTFGFGPFTVLGRRVLDERAAVRLDGRLQALAGRGLPVLRATGAQYMVLARKVEVRA